MILETVESDVIHAIGYDPEIQLLEIIFNDGRIYQYRGVPPAMFQEFKQAESKGRYFQENIRDEFQYWQFDAQAAKFVRGTEGRRPTADGRTPTADSRRKTADKRRKQDRQRTTADRRQKTEAGRRKKTNG